MYYKLSLTYRGEQLLFADRKYDNLASAMTRARHLVNVTTLHDLPCAMDLSGGNWIDYLSRQDWQTENEFNLAADYTHEGCALLSVIGCADD